VGEDSDPPAASPGEVVVLQPGEVHDTVLDMTNPEWFLTKVEPADGDKPMSMGDLDVIWSESFRIEYTPPSAEECSGFPDADLIRHAALRSRAFNPIRGVD
jgi:hypothetical protein